MKNLLQETIELLEFKNKKESDVKWVGNMIYKTSWNDFKSKANTEYDSGFGAPKVAQDLLVVGDNWWLERHDYDGSEWWEYKETPKEPVNEIELTALTISQAEDLGFDVSCGWEDLLSINGIKEN